MGKFDKCERIFDRVCRKSSVHEAIIYIEDMDGKMSWSRGDNRNIDSLMCMASMTKLFVTTCIMQLCDEKKIELSDKISKYLDEETMKGLHVYKGVDYSNELTVADLLFQVSGLPDYYYSKRKGRPSFEQLMWEENEFVPFAEMVRACKELKPVFEPRHLGRAYYADVNFDLLGKIIEYILGVTLQEAFRRRIIEPLGLCQTYVLENEEEIAPPAYRKGKAHQINRFLMCCPASGGGITTARELMVFMKAFWGGGLFDKKHFEGLKRHNKLQLMYGSMQYAGGHMFLNAGYPFTKKHTFRGHSGATGSIAYFCEESGLFFVGDLNNSVPGMLENMMLRMEMSLREK